MTTPNLQLPEVPQAILDAADEINAGFQELDAIVQLAVIDKDLNVPPSNPVQGDRYIVADGAIGAWTGRSRHVASYLPGGWRFYVPRPGWRARVLDEGTDYVYSNTEWVTLASTAVRTFGATWVKPTSAISTPVNDVPVRVPVDCRIIKVSMATIGGPGSCLTDIYRSQVYPPDSGDSICGATPPEINSAESMENSSLIDWDLDLQADDWLLFHLETSTNFKLVYIVLFCETVTA